MKTKIITLYLFFLCFFCLSILSAQNESVKNSFYIQNNKLPQNESYFINAISKADMEAYRLREKDVKINFSEGFECVLLAAEKLASRGIKVDLESYQSDFDYGFVLPLFSISNDGKLIATYQKQSKINTIK